MEEPGRGFLRMCAVTIRKNGVEEVGSRIGEDVDSDIPIFTAGFANLYHHGKPFLSSRQDLRGTYGRKRRPSPRPVILSLGQDDLMT